MSCLRIFFNSPVLLFENQCRGIFPKWSINTAQIFVPNMKEALCAKAVHRALQMKTRMMAIVAMAKKSAIKLLLVPFCRLRKTIQAIKMGIG